jgi:hypothetical protein
MIKKTFLFLSDMADATMLRGANMNFLNKTNLPFAMTMTNTTMVD